METDNPNISVIIVNYNGRGCLEDLLKSLSLQTFTRFEILIVDNGSTDDSVAFIEKEFPKVRVFHSKKNNFSAGNNLGIKNAKSEYVFILNNDTELDARCLESLSTAIKSSDSSVGMWATKILNYYQRDMIDSAGLIIYRDGLSRGRGRMEKDGHQYDVEEEVCFPSGCAALYKKSVLENLGYFDEDFEFYLEDSDLGFRFRLAGWKCMYIPTAKLYHKYSFSMGKYSPRKAYLIERNRIWLLIKSYPISLLASTPLYSIKRYLFQLFGMISGKGAASRFAQQYSSVKLFMVVLRAWIGALSLSISMIRKRSDFRSNIRINFSEFKSLFRRFPLSANDLSLKD